jgi:gas vesicle protein
MATCNLFRGLIVGGIIGCAAGILFAPKSGKETRADICKSADDLYDKTRVRADKTLRKLEELVAEGLDLYAGEKERLKKSIEAGVEAFKEYPAGPHKAG